MPHFASNFLDIGAIKAVSSPACVKHLANLAPRSEHARNSFAALKETFPSRELDIRLKSKADSYYVGKMGNAESPFPA